MPLWKKRTNSWCLQLSQDDVSRTLHRNIYQIVHVNSPSTCRFSLVEHNVIILPNIGIQLLWWAAVQIRLRLWTCKAIPLHHKESHLTSSQIFLLYRLNSARNVRFSIKLECAGNKVRWKVSEKPPSWHEGSGRIDKNFRGEFISFLGWRFNAVGGMFSSRNHIARRFVNGYWVISSRKTVRPFNAGVEKIADFVGFFLFFFV